MIRVTAECSTTIARFTIQEVHEQERRLSLIGTGFTLRDLKKLGIERADVENLRITESRDFTAPTAEQVRAALKPLECPNCSRPVKDHPENGCVLAALVQVVRERGNLDAAQLDSLHANIDTNALWEALGAIVDLLEEGAFSPDGVQS